MEFENSQREDSQEMDLEVDIEALFQFKLNNKCS